MIGRDDRRRVLADTLVEEARGRAARHRFFHWEIGFPNVWSNLVSAAPKGGFDAVIGNPPYVRQELLGDELKRALKAGYAAFDGMADLYVYFYEQGLRLLRPGGRLSYVVTNKWLKAGYAGGLRELFATKAQVEFVADFGHARHFFPDADVFPSVVVVRKPVPGAPADTEVCVIPRDAVPAKGLSAAVAAATYPLPRVHFTRESWTLEPPAVVALLDKIRRSGVRLAHYVGSGPINGVKTGLNEAFLIDSVARDSLVKDDPGCAEIIKPYRRGQDIERWVGDAPSDWMICLAPSPSVHRPWSDLTETDAEQVFARMFPAIRRRFRSYEKELRSRASRGKFWWELQTSPSGGAYSEPGIIY